MLASVNAVLAPVVEEVNRLRDLDTDRGAPRTSQPLARNQQAVLIGSLIFCLALISAVLVVVIKV